VSLNCDKTTVGTGIIKTLKILGSTSVNLFQMIVWAQKNGATGEFISLAPIYWDTAPLRGAVRPEVAYAQAAKETGYGKFGGTIDATFKNPCGLKTSTGGANDDPQAHQRFASWQDGITAHLDHLALYAGAYGYPRRNTSPDPRHFPYLYGKAPTVEELSGKWAPSVSYGYTLIYMIEAMTNVPQNEDASIVAAIRSLLQK
jgi:N-acetylmuramoyl-L-alanine amidase